MDAQRLLIWEVRERIYFTRKRLFGTTSLYLLCVRAPDGGRVKGRVEARLKNLPIFFFFFLICFIHTALHACRQKALNNLSNVGYHARMIWYDMIWYWAGGEGRSRDLSCEEDAAVYEINIQLRYLSNLDWKCCQFMGQGNFVWGWGGPPGVGGKPMG